MTNFYRALFFLTLALPLVCSAQTIDPSHYRDLAKQFNERAKAKDWPGAHDVLTEIGRELPAPTPRFLLLNATWKCISATRQKQSSGWKNTLPLASSSTLLKRAT